jgi:release factor glutamine methyltransferase
MTEQELILTEVLNCNRIDLYLGSPSLTKENKERLMWMQQRRMSGEPLQYIIGHCDFMGIPLNVDERALIPRPETEILVECVLEKMKAASKSPLNILDLGTGSGNVAIALASLASLAVHQKGCFVTSVDISPGAITLAKENAQRNNVADRIQFVCGDMQSFMRQLMSEGKSFDGIVSNPPYIKTADLSFLPKDVQHEPHTALDGGKDGLFYHRLIVEYGARLLRDQGLLALEIGDGQRVDLAQMLSQTSYQQVQFIKDYRGTDRIILATHSLEKG